MWVENTMKKINMWERIYNNSLNNDLSESWLIIPENLATEHWKAKIIHDGIKFRKKCTRNRHNCRYALKIVYNDLRIMLLVESTFSGRIQKAYPRHPDVVTSGCDRGGSTTSDSGDDGDNNGTQLAAPVLAQSSVEETAFVRLSFLKPLRQFLHLRAAGIPRRPGLMTL